MNDYHVAGLPSQRQRRVAELVRQHLAEFMIKYSFGVPEIDDRIISIQGVDISPDLRIATVFIMPIGGPKKDDLLLKRLGQNKAVLRQHLARNMTTKYLPDLRFRFDEGLAKADRIDQLLASEAVRRDLQKKA